MATATLIATLTQGSADAFIQTSLNTGLTGTDNNAFKVIGMLVELPNFIANASGQEREFQITRSNQVAMTNIANDDLLFKYKDRMTFVTSGVSLSQSVIEIVPENEIILIESQIYVGFDTAATGNSNVAILRVIVETTKVTTDERIAILQSRIN